jgi:GTP-binding protein
MFIDELSFRVISGHGGAGCVSFRREKFIPRGGPDGGDGGKGGDVIFIAKKSLSSLAKHQGKKIFKAENGQPGSGRDKIGRDGNNIIIDVPVGTVIYDAETGDILYDLKNDEDEFIIAKGGMGGKGNAFFKSATNQIPRFSQPGEEETELHIRLELKLIADVGLVGLPNAGKSTLLSSITRAHPKIAAYPFTTLFPHLGVVYVDRVRQFIMADLPGLIEGAHTGAGLGIRFLKHIERTGLLLFVIDIYDENYDKTYLTLVNELKKFNKTMIKKPRIIVLNKTDLLLDEEAEEKLLNFKKKLKDNIEVFLISGVTGNGLKELKEKLYASVKG